MFVIDIHSHILPGIDDGSINIEESIAIAKAAWAAGTSTMVATPHVLDGLSAELNSRVLNTFDRFRQKLFEVLPEMNLLLGSEIYFRPGLADIAGYDIATFDAKRRYILVEFSLTDIPRGFEKELKNVAASGVIPIVAHPERIAAVVRDTLLVERMVEAGALIQLNSGSIMGLFGSAVKRTAHGLLKAGLVHVIASDAHDARHRGPSLKEAVATVSKLMGRTEALRLVIDNPRAIITGASWSDKKVDGFALEGVR